MPRSIVRREMCFFVMIIASPTCVRVPAANVPLSLPSFPPLPRDIWNAGLLMTPMMNDDIWWLLVLRRVRTILRTVGMSNDSTRRPSA